MWDWIRTVDELARAGTPFAIVTVVATTGSTPREPGARMVVLADGTFRGTVGGGHLEQLCIDDARACLARSRNASATAVSKMVRYPLGAKTGQCCGGMVDVFVETVNVGPTLYLFGAGHVGQAVCRVLVGTPFRVEVVDEREDWLASPDIPASVTRHAGAWDEHVKAFRWDAARTYVAIMTHRHDVDEDIVEWIVKQPAKYIGLIGSQTKWSRFQMRLREKGATDEALARVKCPIGVDVGGKAPQEVAISVAAELLKTHHGR